MTAAQGASRWRLIEFISFPPHGEYNNLAIVRPLQQPPSFKFARSCNLGGFLVSLMAAITTTTTPHQANLSTPILSIAPTARAGTIP